MGLTMGQRKAVTLIKARAYAREGRAGKAWILDELVKLTGWNRDYARRAVRQALELRPVRPRPARDPVYGPAVIDALVCAGYSIVQKDHSVVVTASAKRR